MNVKSQLIIYNAKKRKKNVGNVNRLRGRQKKEKMKREKGSWKRADRVRKIRLVIEREREKERSRERKREK